MKVGRRPCPYSAAQCTHKCCYQQGKVITSIMVTIMVATMVTIKVTIMVTIKVTTMVTIKVTIIMVTIIMVTIIMNNRMFICVI